MRPWDPTNSDVEANLEPHVQRGESLVSTAISHRRFTVEEFHRMGETGILRDDDRVELLDGQIIQMAPIGSPHAACVDRLTRLFTERLGGRVIVRVQGPVHIGRYSQLVPDLALLRPRDDFYAAAHPRPRDVLLLVEVADTTLAHDRRIKVPTYGRAGIRECWLVDLTNRRVEVFREPSATHGYGESKSVGDGESVDAISLPGLSLQIAEILG